MKKFMGWLMVLAVGAMIMGCSEEKKEVKKETPKPPAETPKDPK